ncbi:MAG: hypothetical protein KAS32_25350 [Candidatus Peribacteraceae bacterium]|nr:hypothetical protein [Candidatus Peribacteraceae bacterium]
MATTLIAIGTGVQAAGIIQQGRVAAAEGKSRQNIAEYNAAVQAREAEALRQKAGFESKRQAERGARIKSALTAKIAAAGGLGSPVAADLVAEQAAELELENLLIGYEGEIGAQRALSKAELDRLQGRFYKERGVTQRKASYVRAAGTLLTGFGQAGAYGGTGGSELTTLPGQSGVYRRTTWGR